MALVTAAESKKANVSCEDVCKSAAVAATADGVENICDVTNYSLASAAANLSGRVCEYVGFCAPTAADYPNAKIGSTYKALLVDSTKTPQLWDAEIYILTANGWEKMATEVSDSQRIGFSSVLTVADAAATPTAAQVVGGVIKMTPGQARGCTLPAAADILALMPGAKIGSSIEFVVLNCAAATHVASVVCDAAITNLGIAGHLDVAAATSARFRLIASNVTTAAFNLVRA